MRIVSYNILDGGTGRLDELSAVLERQQADVIGLVEAEDVELVQAIAKRLRMDFVVAAGRKHASALLTRWTLQQTVNHGVLSRAFEKSVLEAVVVTSQKKQVPLAVVHLHSRAFEENEKVREKEVTALLQLMSRHRSAGTPHLLLGDFNADGPTQQIDLAKAKPRTKEAYKANGGVIPRRSIQMVLDAGYVDTLNVAKGAEADVTASFTTTHPGQRVDHIFAWGVEARAIRNAWVEQGELAVEASDHFPVGVELDL